MFSEFTHVVAWLGASLLSMTLTLHCVERPQTVYPGPFCFVVFSFQSLNSTVLNYLQLLPSLLFCINRIFFFRGMLGSQKD